MQWTRASRELLVRAESDLLRHAVKTPFYPFQIGVDLGLDSKPSSSPLSGSHCSYTGYFHSLLSRLCSKPGELYINAVDSRDPRTYLPAQNVGVGTPDRTGTATVSSSDTCSITKWWRGEAPSETSGDGIQASEGVGKTTRTNSLLQTVDTSCMQQTKAAGAADESEPDVLLMCHGFGSGLGMFYPNYDFFIHQGLRVISVDWLGMGGSGRPSFPRRPPCASAGEERETVAAAEAFFVDSLESWRQKMGLRSFFLLGHSLGGYLATRYALKYPQAVRSLVLVSPAGLPRPPTHVYGYDAPSSGTLRSSSSSSSPSPSTPGDISTSTSASTTTTEEATTPPELAERLSETAEPARDLRLDLLERAWHSNFTPQGLVRALGPYGEQFVHRAVAARFRSTSLVADPDLATRVAQYVYQITASPPSGEFAMNALLSPVPYGPHRGVYARAPLTEDVRRLPCPTTVLFGEHDWMNHTQMPAICATLPAGSPGLKVVRRAGHHLYLDNVEDYHRAVMDGLRW